MDLAPLMNGLANLPLPSAQTLLVGVLILFASLALMYSSIGTRIGDRLYQAMFTNWRLALLGLTGVILSIASGWTTWDGMRNFTREPVLSLMITFGIQGVMLIVAWLIGESFRDGHEPEPAIAAWGSMLFSGVPRNSLQPVASSIAGILLFSRPRASSIYRGVFGSPEASVLKAQTVDGNGGIDRLWCGEPAHRRAPVVHSADPAHRQCRQRRSRRLRTQSLRIMVRSAVLWVMFLACMATSVFFSFDSLFSTIFPAERAGAGRRTQSAEPGCRYRQRCRATWPPSRRLRGTGHDCSRRPSPGKRYDANLERLAEFGLRCSADEKLQAFFEERMRERQASH